MPTAATCVVGASRGSRLTGNVMSKRVRLFSGVVTRTIARSCSRSCASPTTVATTASLVASQKETRSTFAKIAPGLLHSWT